MSLRDSLLSTIDALRALPNTFGIRRYTVTFRTRTWSGASPGEGTATDSNTTISPVPRVRLVTSKEVADSGGTYRDGDFMIGPITPAYTSPSSGGYAPSALNIRPSADNKDVAIILVGDEGTIECEAVEFDFSRPFRSMVVARTIRSPSRG